MSTPWRYFDAPMPVAVDLHPECDAGGWHVAIEGFVPDDVTNVVVWDGPAWDSATEFWVAGDWWADVVGDLMGMQHTAGRQEIDGYHEASEVTMTLDNSSGRYTQFQSVGGVVSADQFFPGRRIAVWCDVLDDHPQHGAGVYAQPRFYGRIEEWDENLVTPEGFPPHIAVRAVDGFVQLNTALDATEWKMGAEADLPNRRLSTMLDLAGWPTTERRRLDAGTLTLRSLVSVNSILEEMHHTADSDGGVVYIDTDGSFMYRDRDWRLGRDDQVNSWNFDDNCGDYSWEFSSGDPVVNTADVVNLVHMENVDRLKVDAQDVASLAKYGKHPFSKDGMLWRHQADAATLAQHILTQRADLYWRFTQLDLYPSESNDLLRLVTSLRIGDTMNVSRTMRPGQQLNLVCLVEGWTMNLLPGGFPTFNVYLSKSR